jgi:predicted dehydrogenase/nucleoside-diphosphate-sugar epimerase
MGLHHAKAVSLLPNAELVAVADSDADPEVIGKDLPAGIRLFRGASELLESLGPDVVHICTPPPTHIPLAELAVKNGAHVYVEKPFALGANEAEQLIALAQRLGRKVCAGHQLLYEGPALEARKLLEKIGRVVHVESYFAFRPVRRSLDGRGVMPPTDQLLDILPHPVYLLLHFLEMGLPPGCAAPVELRGLEIRTNGSVHGILRCGDATGTLAVTLEGRPVESYVRIVGTNGSLFADFVRGMTVALPGPGTSTVSKIVNPYSQAWQIAAGTSRALSGRAMRKQKSYPGLLEIIGAFYESIEKNTTAVPDGRSIVETVRVCETVGERLKTMEAEENRSSEAELKRLEARLPQPETGRGRVLVTGGTGMLGRAVTAELRKQGWPTRVVSRRMPPASKRTPGVEYVEVDLGETVASAVLNGVATVVHCAAETAGGREAHARNSVGATRNLIAAMAEAGVKRLIHISSVAVLEGSGKTGGPVDEKTPLIHDPESRGPYVWGKAESEEMARDLCSSLGVELRVIRPGPLVDFDAFEAPGRLGREVGPFFVAVGPRRSRLSLCEVQTAANVVRGYVDDFDAAPPVLNLLEPDPPTRDELVSRLKANRPDLKVIRIPSSLLWTGSRLAIVVQRILRPAKTPVDLYGAFVSERYRTDLAAEVIRQGERSRVRLGKTAQVQSSHPLAGRKERGSMNEEHG